MRACQSLASLADATSVAVASKTLRKPISCGNPAGKLFD